MSHKKLFIGLTIVIAIFLLFFLSQFRRFQTITTHPSSEPLISIASTNIPIDATDVVLGNPGAELTIVEFSSLDCDQCRETHLKIANFVKNNSGKVRLYWKDTILPKYFIQMSKTASAAVFCSASQNPALQFGFIESAMRNNIYFNETGIKKAATEAGLNADNLWQCANSAEAQAKGDSSTLLAQSVGIKSLPTIFINNKKINLEEGVDLEKLLETLIKE